MEFFFMIFPLTFLLENFVQPRMIKRLSAKTQVMMVQTRDFYPVLKWRKYWDVYCDVLMADLIINSISGMTIKI